LDKLHILLTATTITNSEVGNVFFKARLIAGLASFCRRVEKTFYPWKEPPRQNSFSYQLVFALLLSHSMTFS